MGIDILNEMVFRGNWIQRVFKQPLSGVIDVIPGRNTHGSCIDLVLQFQRIGSHAQENPFGLDIQQPLVEESSDTESVFDQAKRSFCLDASVYPEFDTFAIGDIL